MEGPPQKKAWLVLEDKTVVEGTSFGAEKTVYGELVFNTGMTGYQESLTDPSYNGQVLMFTYPMVGNYGVNPQDWESDKIWPRAVVVREWCIHPEHRLSTMNLDEWLRKEGIPGISGIDTRALTLKTRNFGCLKCFVTTDEDEVPELLRRISDMPSVEVDNLAAEASTKEVLRYGRNEEGVLTQTEMDANAYTVAVLDTGIKRNILRHLSRRFNVIHFPWDATPSQIENSKAHALFVANGPGDPAHPDVVAKTVATLREVSEKLPTFGICYGNQLMALAYGARTNKMKFGHRGANIPVRVEGTAVVRITSQNHGFAVDAESVAGTGLRIWERCPNDGTVEALQHETLPIFTTQYHPEASPGPLDSGHHFDNFLLMVKQVHEGKFEPGQFPSVKGAH